MIALAIETPTELLEKYMARRTKSPAGRSSFSEGSWGSWQVTMGVLA